MNYVEIMIDFVAAVALAAAQPDPIASYTLVAATSVADSGLVARTVMPAGAACPDLTVVRRTSKGVVKKTYSMKVRKPAATAKRAFNTVRVCSRNMPTKAVRASIDGRRIPSSMPSSVTTMAMLADTGCRVRGATIQDCNSPAAWPLKTIARRIAKEKPDIILNPGDYYYREQACPPADQALCGGTPPPVAGMPFTDSADGWLVDVIRPMKPMFRSAPMALLRGNHETCDRGGNGFFLFFDPRPDTAGLCGPVNGVAPAPATTPTWSFTIDVAKGRTLRVAMVDSAYGEDSVVDSWAAAQRPTYVAARKQTKAKKGRQSWLMTHRPVFSHVTSQFAPKPPTQWTPWGSLDQTAASYGLLDTYQLILSSHLHIAQAVQIPGQPGSLVLGNGGTLLDPTSGYEVPAYGPLANASGQRVDPALAPYPNPTMSWTSVQFGYAMATPTGNSGWKVSHRTPAGQQFASCSLNKKIGCS